MEFVEDVSPARWVEDSLSEFGKVRSILPEGFAAYTRVFHPAYLDSAGEEPMRWCVATDIDLFDTYVGGSSECIEAILSCKDLEALPTMLDARLDIGGDTITSRAAPRSESRLQVAAQSAKLSTQADLT